MFIGAVSAGLVALGLIATATHIGTAFYAFGLVILSTLSLVGFMTFERVLQSGIEDQGYAERIARLRAYYFDYAPEITPYLASVPPAQRMDIQGLPGGYRQGFRTVAGMIGVITSVLTGSVTGLLAAIATDHSAIAGFVTGGGVTLAALAALLRFLNSAWQQTRQLQPFSGELQPFSDQRGPGAMEGGDGSGS